jgi:hypothetical protein
VLELVQISGFGTSFGHVLRLPAGANKKARA